MKLMMIQFRKRLVLTKTYLLKYPRMNLKTKGNKNPRQNDNIKRNHKQIRFQRIKEDGHRRSMSCSSRHFMSMARTGTKWVKWFKQETSNK